jgi:serine acetyltransferase
MATPSKPIVFTRMQIIKMISTNMRCYDGVQAAYWHRILIAIWKSDRKRGAIAAYIRAEIELGVAA